MKIDLFHWFGVEYVCLLNMWFNGFLIQFVVLHLKNRIRMYLYRLAIYSLDCMTIMNVMNAQNPKRIIWYELYNLDINIAINRENWKYFLTSPIMRRRKRKIKFILFVKQNCLVNQVMVSISDGKDLRENEVVFSNCVIMDCTFRYSLDYQKWLFSP